MAKCHKSECLLNFQGTGRWWTRLLEYIPGFVSGFQFGYTSHYSLTMMTSSPKTRKLTVSLCRLYVKKIFLSMAFKFFSFKARYSAGNYTSWAKQEREFSKKMVVRHPQTTPSVLKLEGWNFAYKLLILIPKKLLMSYLNFCLGAEIWLKITAILSMVADFCPLSLIALTILKLES